MSNRNIQPDPVYTITQSEMTLRDYFAGQVLTGIMANQYDTGTYDETAIICYKYADAMMKAREKL